MAAELAFNIHEARREEVPPHLCRVHYHSASPYQRRIGFVSRALVNNAQVPLDSNDQFKAAVEKAFDCDSKVPSPFIALFSHRKYAEDWAIFQMQCICGEWYEVVQLKSAEMTTCYLYNLDALVKKLDIQLPHGAAAHAEKGEWLCADLVPQKAISEVRSASDIQKERRERANQERRSRESTVQDCLTCGP